MGKINSGYGLFFRFKGSFKVDTLRVWRVVERAVEFEEPGWVVEDIERQSKLLFHFCTGGKVLYNAGEFHRIWAMNKFEVLGEVAAVEAEEEVVEGECKF